jgi:hypothetical protein
LEERTTTERSPYLLGLRQLYTELGLLNENGETLPLHTVCKHSGSCWHGAKARVPKETGDRAGISRPYIGAHYDEARIVFIGINMNDAGGYLKLQALTEEAKTALEQGKKRVNFGMPYSEYRGTLLWHRIASYAHILMSGDPTTRSYEPLDSSPTPSQLSLALDYVSITNHVKCSPHDKPKRENSAPTEGMWKYCGAQILRRELAILEPRIVVVLGRGDNLWYFQQSALGSDALEWRDSGSTTERRVLVSKVAISGVPTALVVVPHPHARGVQIRNVMTELRQAVPRFITGFCSS